MRVPDSLSYNNAIRYMNESKAKLDKLSTITATRKNYQNVSDNPSVVSSAFVLKSSVSASEGYIKTSEETEDWMKNSETAFSLMNDLISEANTIMLKGLSDSVSASERINDYAVQITHVLNQAIAIANTSYNGSYIFSGYQLNTKPFELASDGMSVQYNGDNGKMSRELSPGVTVTMNSDGVASFNEFFDALILAKHGLETDNDTEMNDALADIATSLNSMNKNRTNNSALLKQIGTNIDHLETTKLELKSLLSVKEDANMTEAVSMFNIQKTTYETVLEVGSRAISSLNLFDVLG